MPASLAIRTSLLGFSVWLAAAGATNIWLDVPFVKQVKDGCGAACISMVLRYWAVALGRDAGDSSDAAVIHKELFSEEDRGIRAQDMAQYFKSQGFRAFAFKGDWDTLEQHLLKGRPLIVSLKKDAPSTPFHYLVVVGMDRDRDVILVNDPAGRKFQRLGRRNFEKDWSGSGNWTLLALPQSGG